VSDQTTYKGSDDHPGLRTGMHEVDDRPRGYSPAQVRDDRGESSITFEPAEASDPAVLQREHYGTRERGSAHFGIGRGAGRKVGPEVEALRAAQGARKTVARFLELSDSPVLRHFPEISKAKLTKAREALEEACQRVEEGAGALERVYPEHRAAVEAHAQAVEEAVLEGKEEPTLDVRDPAIGVRTGRARLGSLVTLADRARKAFEDALAEAERAMDKPVADGFGQTWESTVAKVAEAAAAVEKLAVARNIATRYHVERSGGELTAGRMPVDVDALARQLREVADALAIPAPELTDVAMDPSRAQREQMAQRPDLMWELAVIERRENFAKTSFTIAFGKSLPPGVQARYGEGAPADVDGDSYWWGAGR
jgi:hypothetical protein